MTDAPDARRCSLIRWKRWPEERPKDKAQCFIDTSDDAAHPWWHILEYRASVNGWFEDRRGTEYRIHPRDGAPFAPILSLPSDPLEALREAIPWMRRIESAANSSGDWNTARKMESFFSDNADLISLAEGEDRDPRKEEGGE